MDPIDALTRLGGVGTKPALMRLTSAGKLRTALKNREVHRIGRGRYALPGAEKALLKASELHGMASHGSAAELHRWEVASPSITPTVTVPRNQGIKSHRGVQVFWADLGEESGLVTSPTRTVVDCARTLPFAEALAIADSALRHGDVDAERLIQAATQVHGKGAKQVRRVAEHASRLSANPFESVLRAIALDAGLHVLPQVTIRVAGKNLHPDVVDVDLRLALETDSWQWHASRKAHNRDCWRYTVLVVNGWTVLRFTWEQVMLDPEFVRFCLLTWLGDHGDRQTSAKQAA